MHLHILPTMNPDGFALRRRGNANNVDLNRDFPDQFFPINDGINYRQPETRAIMNWVKQEHFTAFASLHGVIILSLALIRFLFLVYNLAHLMGVSPFCFVFLLVTSKGTIFLLYLVTYVAFNFRCYIYQFPPPLPYSKLLL